MTFFVQFNGDTGANYELLVRNWSAFPSAGTSSNTAATSIVVGIEGDFKQRRAVGYILIPDYLSTAKEKSLRAGGFAPFTNNRLNLNIDGGKWKTTNAPITSLRFFLTSPNTFQGGSLISVYGINAFAS